MSKLIRISKISIDQHNKLADLGYIVAIANGSTPAPVKVTFQHPKPITTIEPWRARQRLKKLPKGEFCCVLCRQLMCDQSCTK